MDKTGFSLSLSNPHVGLNIKQKLFLALGTLGLLAMLVCLFPPEGLEPRLLLLPTLLAMGIGVIGFSWGTYSGKSAGIKNDGVFHAGLSGRGLAAWIFGIFLTAFYVVLYWEPWILGLGVDGNSNTGLVRMFDPLSLFLKGKIASQWFMYGVLYTLLIFVFGIKYIIKYRHNRYQVLRTISVMFFQLGIAFLLAEYMERIDKPWYDFKNMWPLNQYFFDDWSIKGMLSGGNIGWTMLISGFALIVLISPLLTYFYGKRWYCSWVCGCGGLAETAGDAFRQQSDKSLRAWRWERWIIHSVLVLVVIMTLCQLYMFLNYNPEGFIINKSWVTSIALGLFALTALLLILKPRFLANLSPLARNTGLVVLVILSGFLIYAWTTGQSNAFVVDNYKFRKAYAFYIGSAFAGVIGVGFYPIMGSRVWCRFGCPMAAILGLQQRFFSRFRITTNGDQCISCGNCSTYCEMGIDVKWYAQRGQNIVRASCVGCGVCSAVCPRGVLKLENGPLKDRFKEPKEE